MSARKGLDMLGAVRGLMQRSRIVNPNFRGREHWIRARAAALPAGTRILDVGAGSAPFRTVFLALRLQDP